jgi:uncharacterized protein YdeI (YjbR/CyaY-like superfamily)
MKKTDKRIDAYISKSAKFAQPILLHFRELVHQACPDIEETIKWGFPHFDFQGMCCSIAAFKEHCTLGFWKANLMKDPQKLFVLLRTEAKAMGHFGKIKSLADLPSDKVLIAYIKEAVKLNKEGINLPPKPKVDASERKPLLVPSFLSNGLKKNKAASSCFNNFSYSQKKEYIDWLTEAKTEATRDKRLAQAIEWIAEGKIRNWKYLRK